jgi:hypothetical protein
MVSVFKFPNPFFEFQLLLLKPPDHRQTSAGPTPRLPEVTDRFPPLLILRTSQTPKNILR